MARIRFLVAFAAMPAFATAAVERPITGHGGPAAAKTARRAP